MTLNERARNGDCSVYWPRRAFGHGGTTVEELETLTGLDDLFTPCVYGVFRRPAIALHVPKGVLQ